MTLWECPCGGDYDDHLATIARLVTAYTQGCDVFLTLDPFMLANLPLWARLCPGVQVLRPTEALAILPTEGPTP